MIQIKRHINELMSSNCYLIYNDVSRHCIIVDPASENSEREIAFIVENSFVLDYIILSHEHSDHTWGVNSLLERFPRVKVIASSVCASELPRASQSYFKLYFDNPSYNYYVNRVDMTVEQLNNVLDWEGELIKFMLTPGHSRGSMCFFIGNALFSGDTLMNCKPYINKRDGNKEDYRKSITKLLQNVMDKVVVYPGHGDTFTIADYNGKKNNII